MKTPLFWKTTERHALSAEYRDIDGEAWERFLAGVRKHGIMNGRKIILHEGKILDGWQLQRACIALDITPAYEKLPSDVDPREFVQIVNDERRHETQEEVAKRIEERRHRVAESRVEGKSIRTIAEEEGVSAKTIQNDIEAATVEGYTVDPPDGKVTGKDNKQHPAMMPPKILCTRCQRVGETKDCEACKEARTPQSKGKSVTNPKAGKPRFDEKKIHKTYGPLVRLVDERGSAMGKGVTSDPRTITITGNGHKRCLDILDLFLEEYAKWLKETA